MKVVLKKTKGDESFGFTFPPAEAELDKSVIKASKIAAALRRIAKQLCKQYKKRGDKPVVGVEFRAVTFVFLLGESEEERYGHS